MTNVILEYTNRGKFMKIQNINNYTNYNCNSKSVKNDETAKIKNYDVIDIKSKTEDGSKTDDIASIKRKIAAEINGGTKARDRKSVV